MSDRSDFDEHTDKVLNNDIRLARMIRDAGKLFATMDHSDFGISTHEVQHLISVVEPLKKRSGELLAELHPAPGVDHG